MSPNSYWDNPPAGVRRCHVLGPNQSRCTFGSSAPVMPAHNHRFRDPFALGGYVWIKDPFAPAANGQPMSTDDRPANDGKDAPFEQCPVFAPNRGIALGRQCQLAAGHAGQHVDRGNYRWSDAPAAGWGNVGHVKAQLWDGQTVEKMRPGDNLQSYLEDLVTGGVIQTPAASPYRSEGHVIRRGQILAALATSEYEAQLLVGGTTADKLWRDKASAAERSAKYWEGRWRDIQQGEMVSAADHAKVWNDLRDSRDRHKRATAHIARLTAELATATAQLEGARDAAAKLRDNRDHWRTKAGQLDVTLANTNRNQSLLWWRDRVSTLQKRVEELQQRAERIEIERSKWMSRHRELAAAALHMLHRLNTIVGDHDAPEFTHAAATEAVDKLLDQLEVTNGANLALSERVEQLEEHLKASREAAEVDRKALESLRMNSQCPRLAPAVTEPGSLVLSLVERKCVRVNGHNGAHIRMNGDAW